MIIKPLHDRVLVTRTPSEAKTSGGIFIPDTAKEKPQQGVVAAVGPGKWTENGELIPSQVKEGDRILFSKYAGTEIKLNGVKYLFMKEEDILAVFQD